MSGVFVDRDGVLVRSAVVDGKAMAVRRLADFRLLPGAAAGFEKLRSRGFKTVIVTNQPDVGKGLISGETLASMHARLRERLAPDAIEVCPHVQSAGCDCRKPKPGMLLAAASRLKIDLGRSFMIGDRVSDVEAGLAAGCRCIFIDRNYREGRPKGPCQIVKHFPAAVDIILSSSGSGKH